MSIVHNTKQFIDTLIEAEKSNPDDELEFGSNNFTQNTVAILGDSFDERAEVGTSSPFSSNNSAIWNCTNMLMLGRLNFIYIDGVSGSGALTAVSRYNSRIDAAIASGAKWLAIRASINDIGANNTAQDLIIEYSSLFNQINKAGIIVISNTITPSTTVLTSASRRSAWVKFNQWVLNIAPQLFNIVVIPQHHQLADKTVLTGASNSAFVSDGTHPDAVGAMILAETARDTLSKYFTVSHPALSLTAIGVADWSTADPNPINVGTQTATGTGISGNVSTSMGLSVTAGGAVVGSKVTRTDGPGEWQQIVFTGSAANQLATYYTSPGTSALNAELAIGDIVSLAMEFEIDAATAAADCPIPTIRLLFNGVSQETQGFVFNSINQTPGRTGWRGLIETPRIAIPVGTTSLTLQYRFQNKTLNASTIRIGQHGLVNWSRLG